MGSKVLVIGLDGATFDVIMPWIKEGKLPNFAKMVKEGAYGVLKSVIPPQTASGWSSIVTGKNPGKHGVYGFVERAKGSYELLPVNSTNRRSKDVWEIVSEQGKNVCVVNVPMTYPVRKVNGIMISGLMTPYGAKDYAYPKEIIEEVRREVPDFVPPYVVFGGHEEVFLKRLEKYTDSFIKLLRYLLKKEDWEFFMTVFYETDKVQHIFWKYMDEKANLKGKEKFKDVILNYYRKIDSFLGEIMEGMDKDTTLIVVSDHGAERLYKWLHPNVLLMKEGLLKLKRRPITLVRYMLYKIGLTPVNVLRLMFKLNLVHYRKKLGKRKTRKLLKTFFLSLADVDWKRTKAYSIGGWGRIYINLKGREPQGIVTREEYGRLRNDIVDMLKNVRDPESGEFIYKGGGIYGKEELYEGPYLDLAPDIVFQLRPGYISFPGYEFGAGEVVTKIYGWSAGHSVDGIIMMYGSKVARGKEIKGARVYDVAPTILYLLGSSIPEDMDGVVIKDALQKTIIEITPINYSKSPSNIAIDQEAYTEEEAEQIKKQLRLLGYI